MVHHRIVSRAIASVLAVIMAVAFVFAPAVKASAETAELTVAQNGMNVNIKSVIDTEAELFSWMGSLEYEDQILAYAALYLGEAGLAVSLQPVPDQFYGIDLKNFQENLKNSIFAPDSGSSFALDQQSYDFLTNGVQMEITTTVPQLSDEATNAAMAAVEKYGAIIAGDFAGGMEMRMASETVYVGSQAIDTSAVTVMLDAADLAKVIDDVLAAAAEDESLKGLIAELYDAGIASGQVPNVPEELQGVPGADVMDALWQQLPQLKEQAAEAFAETDLSLAVTVNMSKQGGSLIRVSLAVTSDGDTLAVRATMGESFATSEVISLEILMDDKVEMEIAHRILENTDKAYAAAFTITERVYEDMKVTFNWNKVTGTYALTMTTNDYFGDEVFDNTNTLTGTLSVTDDALTVTFDTLNGESLGEIRLTVNGENGLTMPEYTEILTLNEEEFEGLVETVMASINSLTGAAA